MSSYQENVTNQSIFWCHLTSVRLSCLRFNWTLMQYVILISEEVQRFVIFWRLQHVIQLDFWFLYSWTIWMDFPCFCYHFDSINTACMNFCASFQFWYLNCHKGPTISLLDVRLGNLIFAFGLHMSIWSSLLMHVSLLWHK